MQNLSIAPNATQNGSQILFTFLNATMQNQYQMSERATSLKLIDKKPNSFNKVCSKSVGFLCTR